MSRLSDDELHVALWRYTNSRGKLNARLYDIAKDLGYSQPNLTERVQNLAKQGRVKKVKWQFWISDPATWNTTGSPD